MFIKRLCEIFGSLFKKAGRNKDICAKQVDNDIAINQLISLAEQVISDCHNQSKPSKEIIRYFLVELRKIRSAESEYE